MQFKYQSDFENLAVVCPPNNYSTVSMAAYRWVFNDIRHLDNFTPQYYRNPKRFLTSGDVEKCKALSLSLFVSLESAQARFEALQEVLGAKAYRTLGNQIASGLLTEEDGVQGDLDQKGHFSFHPAAESRFKVSFSIIVAL